MSIDSARSSPPDVKALLVRQAFRSPSLGLVLALSIAVLVLSIAVLVLSIAVLVLVLDRALGYSLSSLDQASQHEHDPFQVRLASAIRCVVDCIANTRIIVNRSTLKCRTASDLEESAFVLQGLFAVAFSDVQWNRLGRPEPLVTSRSIDSGPSFGDLPRERNVFDRKAINIKSFIIESRLCHHAPFEYEYRCTEYEYELLTNVPASPGGGS